MLSEYTVDDKDLLNDAFEITLLITDIVLDLPDEIEGDLRKEIFIFEQMCVSYAKRQRLNKDLKLWKALCACRVLRNIIDLCYEYGYIEEAIYGNVSYVLRNYRGRIEGHVNKIQWENEVQPLRVLCQ